MYIMLFLIRYCMRIFLHNNPSFVRLTHLNHFIVRHKSCSHSTLYKNNLERSHNSYSQYISLYSSYHHLLKPITYITSISKHYYQLQSTIFEVMSSRSQSILQLTSTRFSPSFTHNYPINY